MHEETLEHFRTHGWWRLTNVFDEDAAQGMRDAVWRALAEQGVARDDPATWTIERPAHLRHVKDDPAFQAVANDRLRQAIDTILDGQAYQQPKNWGAAFVAFPSKSAWAMPQKGWHIDANYAGALSPVRGVKILALFGDVAPRGGGTLFLSGSHRLIHAWFKANPPPPGARSADMRTLLRQHPYIRDLHGLDDPTARVTRFMDRVEDVDGIPLQVMEHTGHAGDVLLMHPLLLHVAAPNSTMAPRFMLSGGVTNDQWGWGD